MSTKINPWFEAKRLLEEDFLNDFVTEDTKVEEACDMRDEYKACELRKFKKNYKALMKKLTITNNENEIDTSSSKKKGVKKKAINPWHKAKRMLHQDYLDDFVTEDTEMKDTYNLQPEYQACEFQKFKTNYKAMMKRINKDKERAERDIMAYNKDTRIYTIAKDDPMQWHGSDAEFFLKQDVKNGLHEEMKPMQLHQTCEEYQKFSVKVFRKHIYQETRKNNDSNYWLVKKTKKEKKKQAKKEGEKYEDDDNIFYDLVMNIHRRWFFYTHDNNTLCCCIFFI